MNRIEFALWLRGYAVLLTAIFSLPFYFITQQFEGYYIGAGLVFAWSIEQIFVYSRIDKLKEGVEQK
jgi:hypothetical protein